MIMKGFRRILLSPHFKESGREILQGLQDLLSEERLRREASSHLLMIDGLKRVIASPLFKKRGREILQGLQDAFSKGQLKSKEWLIESLKKTGKTDLGSVFVLAGWYGILPFMLFRDKEIRLKRIFLFDKDPISVFISESINMDAVKAEWRFKACRMDILDLNLSDPFFEVVRHNGSRCPLKIPADTVINTACEHIKDLELWLGKLPPGKLLALQSSNGFSHPGHVSCAKSLSHFKGQARLQETLFEGELDLGWHKRFLLIGFK